MGFLDWITGKTKCPCCGSRGAKEISGRFHCPNPTCRYFSKMIEGSDAAPGWDTISFGQQEDVPAGFIAVHFRNFRGVDKTFAAEASSGKRSKNRVNVRVAQRGVRIALSRDRIQNLAEVESSFPQQVGPGQDWPSPRERQVLNYHKKHRSTSPLYESIRAKYPNW